MPNWDDLNFFRALATERSFRRASTKIGLSVNTIRARVSRLEQALGMILFVRGRDGLALTVDGEAALDTVVEMDAMIRRLGPRGGKDGVTWPSTLSICCTEGIGEFWLAPRLLSLEQLLSARISFYCDTDQNRIHSVEPDICIGFARPVNSETIVCRLATLHFVLCASRDYLERHGLPQSFDELDGHRFIVQEGYGLEADVLRRIAGAERARRLVAMRMNGSHAVYQALAAGFGIGAIPTYMCGLSDAVELIDLPIALSSELWLSFNRQSLTSSIHRNAVDWIKSCFRQTDYPWFGEDYVHPRETGADPRESVTSLAGISLERIMVPAAGIEPAAP